MTDDTPHLPAKKSLGQHFLTNVRVAEQIAARTGIERGDTVLEIGPGTGMLTRALLARGARVVALEADVRAVELLEQHHAEDIRRGNLVLHHTDVRTHDPSSFVQDVPYRVAANIPYYLSGALIRGLLSSAHQPSRIVLLVQKEVAERIARDKKASLLSIAVAIYGTPQYVATVRRGNFSPVPRVDSAILAIDGISRAAFAELDEQWFFTVVRAGFSARRKQLLGNLSTLRSRAELTSVFQQLDIPLAARGEDLTVATWRALAASLARGAVDAD